MAEVTLTDLTPDTLYSAQFRSLFPGGETPWSAIYLFRTIKDTIAPGAVTNLTVADASGSFVATWDAPTVNSNGTPLNDLKDYVIVVGPDAATLNTSPYRQTFYSTSPRFEFTAEMNKTQFMGKARASIAIGVAARDTYDLVGTQTAAAGINPPPAAPTGLAGMAVQGGVSLTWNPNTTDADFDHYEIFVGSAADFVIGPNDVPVFSGDVTAFTYQTLTIIPLYFEVRSVDTGNSAAGTRIGPFTPIDPFFVDVNAPTIPSGWSLSVTSTIFDAATQRSTINLSWPALTATDLAGYQIRYTLTPGGVPTFFQVGPDETTFSLRDLVPGQNYYVGIQAFDYDANYSVVYNANPYPQAAAVDTTDPAAPTGLTAVAGATSITAFWNANTDADVRLGRGQYEVQISISNTFATTLYTAVTSALVNTFTGLAPSTTYYLRVRAIDSSARPGPWSATVTKLVPAAGAGIVAGELNGSVLAAGTVAGDRVIAGDLDADRLKANTGFANNLSVESTFVLGDVGATTIVPTVAGVPEIRSKNYNFAGGTGFRLTDTGLDIRSGTISAKALQIQDSQNLAPLEIATFEFRTDSIAQFLTSGNGSLGLNTTNYKFGSQSLSFTANSWIYMAPTAAGTSGNISFVNGETYIISWYAQASGTVNMAPRIRNFAGTDIVSSAPVAISGTMTRYSYTYTATADSMVALWWDCTGGGTGYIDGIQVERQVGGLTTPSPWTPPGITSISGGMIKTGSLQSTSLINGQPAWSINMNGAATFADAKVNGTLVVNNNSQYAIQSANYVANSAGWAIRGDGYAEFRNVRVVGDITGSSGTFSGALSVGGTGFNVDTSGNMWMGASTYGAAPFKVNSAGTLTATGANISGSITANSVIGGSGTSRGGIDSSGNIWSGSTNYSYGSGGSPFNVSNTGQLFANNATLSGSFATGNISIANGNLTAPNFALYSSGAFYAYDAHITGAIQSGSTISGVTISGSNITTGAVSGTTPYGQRVELMATNGYDTIRFYPDSGVGSGYVDIRGQTGVYAYWSDYGQWGYRNGFYINGTTQIGNTQSTIYQVGRRDTAYSSSRVRGGTQTLTFNGGSAWLAWSPMDAAPEWVVVTPVNGNYHLYTDVPQYNGVTVYARLGTALIAGGAAANLRISYYTEYLI